MSRLGARMGVAIGLLLAVAMLFSAITLGLRVPRATNLDSFARPGPLDYRSLQSERFTPLSQRFIARELGRLIRIPTATTRRASDPTQPAGAPFAAPVPQIVTHTFTNDDRVDAYVVQSVPFTAKTSTDGATREPGEASGCASSGGTAWYRYRASRDIGLIANTFGSDYATTLGVFHGPDADSLERIGCDSDLSGLAQVPFRAEKGTVYWFQITDRLGGGNLVFNVTFQQVTSRASLATDGTQTDADSLLPTISADGRFVSFYSSARTLTPSHPPPEPCAATAVYDLCRPGVFVRDRQAHSVRRLDIAAPGPVLSPSNPTDQASITGSMSAHGRYVSFYSSHSRLVAGDTNDTWDVFVSDQERQSVERMSVSSGGAEGNGASFNPSISADGRYVAFSSVATNLVPGDTNSVADVFLRDRVAKTTVRVSINSNGEQADMSRSRAFLPESGCHIVALSANGRFVLFRSPASNLVGGDANLAADYFVHDVKRRLTRRVNVSSSEEEGNGDSRQPVGIAQGAVSNDGRYVFFNSDATNLVPRDTNGAEDLFVRDMVAGTTRRVSVSSEGEEADEGVGSSDPFSTYVNLGLTAFVEPQNSSQLAYSATPNARYVAFSADATNLVDGDANETTDVFTRDLTTGTTSLISVASDGERGNGASNSPVLSADGRFVAFRSAASNLVRGDTNAAEDIFVYEIPRGHTLTNWY